MIKIILLFIALIILGIFFFITMNKMEHNKKRDYEYWEIVFFWYIIFPYHLICESAKWGLKKIKYILRGRK